MKNKLDKTTNWYRVDNAGKLYTVLHKPNCTCVFRIAANMKKPVNPDILEKAINELKPRFPSLYVCRKNGFFWYFFEPNKKPVILREEDSVMNKYIDSNINNNYVFAFYYYQNRISLECCHALTDGYGGLELLKAVVYRYLELLGYEMETENKVRTINQEVSPAETEDSYLKYYTEGNRKREKIPDAYHIKGQKLDMSKGTGVILGKIDASQLNLVAKKYNASITGYLSALYTWSVWKTHYDKIKKGEPINVCIPVNLRKMFPSETLRNFSLVFYSSIVCDKDTTFDDVLKQTYQAFVDGIQKEKLQTFLNANVYMEKSCRIKYFPLFLKNIVIGIANTIIGEKNNTRSLSNLGIVDIPESMKNHIIDFECSNTTGVAIMTANNIATISFSREIMDTKIEQFFFSALADEGLKVEIQSNLKEEMN